MEDMGKRVNNFTSIIKQTHSFCHVNIYLGTLFNVPFYMTCKINIKEKQTFSGLKIELPM